MRITTTNNAELVIQAKNEKDFNQAQKVADRIVEDSQGVVVIASGCDTELWIHLTASWDNYQAKDMREMYKDAKRAI